MGLFSRKQSSQPGRRASTRSASASEAQADDLRGRARRRLIGALALVVAAVIVVPLLIQPEPEHQPSTPIVVPAPVPPMPDPDQHLAALSGGSANGSGGDTHTIPDGGEPATELATPDANGASPSAGSAVAPEPPRSEPDAQVGAKPPAKPEPEPAAKPGPKAADKRTDDGSAALAMLEGRQPSKSAPPATQGSFVLQAASYSTEADALARRDGLVAAGITNAFVESASPGGKTAYRLRVGPFPTREAAQAALTRLRSLKYEDSFISSK